MPSNQAFQNRQSERVIQPDDAVDFHSQIADAFDSKYTWKARYIERYQTWTRIIEKYSKPENYVLDIGCGGGILTFFAAELNGTVIGLDASPKMIAICEGKKSDQDLTNLSFIAANINKLDGCSLEPADMVLCAGLLEYLDDLPASLALVVSLLSQKGVLIFSLPNKSSLHRKVEPYIFRALGRPKYYAYVRHVITVDCATAMLKDLGLHVVETAYHGRSPFVSRIFRRFGLAKYSDTLFILVAQKS